MIMRKIIKPLIPNIALKLYQGYKRAIENKRNATLTPAEIFTEIYKNNRWGGEAGDFCSGTGSVMNEITQSYVDKITDYLHSYGPNKPTIVDLGCGDFRIGRNFISHCSQYIAVDVVPDLIEKHKASGYAKEVTFLCLDLIEDVLPDGDVCFLRQVLQHLSNSQIAKILPKLAKYKIIFITEHYPSDRSNTLVNTDKICGAGIRLYDNSGVYLDKPPFNVPTSAVELFLEVSLGRLGAENDAGMLRTYKIQGTFINQSQIQG